MFASSVKNLLGRWPTSRLLAAVFCPRITSKKKNTHTGFVKSPDPTRVICNIYFNFVFMINILCCIRSPLHSMHFLSSCIIFLRILLSIIGLTYLLRIFLSVPDFSNSLCIRCDVIKDASQSLFIFPRCV